MRSNRSIRQANRRTRPNLTLLAGALAACFCFDGLAQVPTNPTGSGFVATQAGSTLTVTTSAPRTSIGWETFSIGKSNKVDFVQPSAASWVMNRVLTPTPSELLGTLSSNGGVFLYNPAGIFVRPGALIDVASFVASTLPISDSDFFSARKRFTALPGAGNISNEGTIKAASGGSIYLVAPNVDNLGGGVISAPNGEILLAAGKSVELVDTGTPGVKIELSADSERALNVGQLLAASGRIGLAGALIKNSGEINASSAVNDGGRIFLKATNQIEVDAAGRILANGRNGGSVQVDAGDMTLVAGLVEAKGEAGKGGRIELLGDKVGVIEAALVDASGATGGGTVLVGGDYQGTNPGVRNASASYFGPQATLKADATDNGDGGKVIIWANETTRAYGTISARGGANGGDGGFVETSAHNYLDVGSIVVDRSAPQGKGGMWLLDPNNVTIDTVAGNNFGGGSFNSVAPGVIFSGSTINPTVNWSTITANLASGPVMITTLGGTAGVGNITFSGGQTFSYNSANALWFVANQDIFGSSIQLSNAGAGDLYFIAGWSGAALPATPWDYASYSVTPGTGSISLIGAGVDTLGSIWAKTGANLNVNVNYPSGSANAWLKAGGNMTLDLWGNLNIRHTAIASPGGSMSAEVAAGGNQTITLHGATSSINIHASTGTGYGGRALLKAGGAQTIDFTASGTHTIDLTGGYGGAVGAGAFAAIEAVGSQQILNSGGGTLNIVLTAGDAGDGTLENDNLFYGGPLLCTNCASHHGAKIETDAAQTINASTITLNGGSGGTGNSAEIDAEGAQTVNLSGALTLQGGSGGGTFISGFGVEGILANGASLGSDTSQILNAGSITLNAGGGSADYSGAILFGPTQTITTSGNFSMTGGGSNAATGGLGANVASAVLVGFDGNADITLNVGGALTLNGGGGASGPAMIGSLLGSATVDINAGSITTSTGVGGAFLGSMTPVGTVTLSTTGNINETAGSSIRAGRLDAVSTGGAVSLLGNNDVTTVALTAYGANAITYNSKAPFVHVESAQSGSGSITINANQVFGTGVGLGTLTTGGNVAVNSNGAIVDDNGTGVLNVQGSAISLNSFYGGSAGLLAISADIYATSSLTANVASSATFGGIRIYETANSLASRSLVDSSSSSVGVSFDTAGSIGAAFGAGSLAVGLTNTTAPVDINAAGDITTASIALPGNATDIAITAGNTLLVAGPVSSTLGSVFLTGLGQVGITANVSALNDIGVLSGSNINFSSGTMSSGGAIAMLGDIVNITGSAQITGAPNGVAVIGASLINIDGGDINTGGEIGLLSGGDVIVTNSGSVRNTSVVSNIGISAAGNLAVSYGGAIMAGDDVFLELTGSTSEIRLDQGGKIVADVATGIPATIYVDFIARSSGGVFIDGIETTTASASGAGLFVVNSSTPATEGAGLSIQYVGGGAGVTSVGSLIGQTTDSTTGGTTDVTDPTTTDLLTTADTLNQEEKQSSTTSDTALTPTEGGNDASNQQKPGQCT